MTYEFKKLEKLCFTKNRKPRDVDSVDLAIVCIIDVITKRLKIF